MVSGSCQKTPVRFIHSYARSHKLCATKQLSNASSPLPSQRSAAGRKRIRSPFLYAHPGKTTAHLPGKGINVNDSFGICTQISVVGSLVRVLSEPGCRKLWCPGCRRHLAQRGCSYPRDKTLWQNPPVWFLYFRWKHTDDDGGVKGKASELPPNPLLYQSRRCEEKSLAG